MDIKVTYRLGSIDVYKTYHPANSYTDALKRQVLLDVGRFLDSMANVNPTLISQPDPSIVIEYGISSKKLSLF